MPLNSAALRVELQNDPDALGYPTFAPTWTDAQVGAAMALLNTPLPAYNKRGTQVSRSDLLGELHVDDLVAMSPQKQAYLQELLKDSIIKNTVQVRDSLTGVGGVGNAQGSLTRISTLVGTVDASRAEDLWGAGVRVQSQHIYEAIQ